MCRILFKRTNFVQFDKNELKESYTYNPDGTGIIYFDPTDEQLHVQKFIKGTDFEEIYKYVQEVEQKKNISNIGIHFRFGTGGGLGIDQVHPIKVRNDLYIMHNGVCREFDIDTSVASDTQWMAYYLKKIGFSLDMLNDPKQQQIYNNIFAGNKLLIMNKGDFKFINENLGNWKDGIWRSYQPNSHWGWEQHSEQEYEDNFVQRSLFDYNKQSIKTKLDPFANLTPEKKQELEKIRTQRGIIEDLQQRLTDIKFERTSYNDEIDFEIELTESLLTCDLVSDALKNKLTEDVVKITPLVASLDMLTSDIDEHLDKAMSCYDQLEEQFFQQNIQNQQQPNKKQEQTKTSNRTRSR